MSFAALSFLLAAAVAQPAPTGPDFRGTIQAGYGAPRGQVVHHAGRFRMDFPRQNGDVESEYDALGQRALIIVVRDAQGRPKTFWIRPYATPRPLGAAGWIDQAAGPRTIAGETCKPQQSPPPTGASVRRCVTADGIDLIVRREGRQMEMLALSRGPVADSDVRPPLELIDLRRWAPPEAFLDPPDRPIGRDYAVRFGSTIIRRSGAWTSDGKTVLNENLGLEIRTSVVESGDLWIRRFEPRRRYGGLEFRPALMQGKAEATILGETCAWTARSTTPDASEFECRTTDGVLLAVGTDSYPSGPSWRPASALSRAAVPLADVLPDPALFRLERYGLAETPIR